ncbi:MAG: amidohydrolase [Erysipelotrichaceae bacterium]|nr:amidohydrolase [Erysipelotrichaceae bacterium]
MKDQLHTIIEEQGTEMIELGRTLFNTPELGYKELETKKILVDFLKKEGFEVEQEYCVSGFSVSLGSGHPHIGLIAEMDAIPTLGHPCANTNDNNAAHACGHSTQGAAMVNALVALKKSGLVKEGKITLFFCPAEEFTDLPYRHQLIAEGKIDYIGGKINMIQQGLFDDVDVCLHCHAMGGSPYYFAIHSQLAGFVYKKFTFKGTASHAAVLPHLGHNALNMFALFQCAAGMMRETFEDEDKNRFHGIVVEGGQTVNSIPERVVYESYIRSFNGKKMLELSDQYTDMAKHCAAALGGDCEVENIPGYLPFKPCVQLGEVVRGNMLRFVGEDQILTDERSVAAGDIGDLGCFKPTIQFGYGGVSGAIHGASMAIADEHRVYVQNAEIIADTVIDLLYTDGLVEDIVRNFEPSMDKESHKAYLG